MNIDLDALRATTERKIADADRLLRILPEDPLDLNRRLAEEICEIGGWLLVILDACMEGEKNK